MSCWLWWMRSCNIRPDRGWSDAGKDTTSPLGVLRENVVLLLHYRVAREPALGVVPLRRLIRRCAGPERIGRGVILELAISPSAAVREPLAILHHEINVMEGAGHQRLTGRRLVLFGVPMDLRHFGAVGERLAVPGNTGLTRVDHRGVPEDHRKHLSVMTDRNGLPAFVSLELGEREPIRHFEGVPVLGGHGPAAQHDGGHYRNDHH